jgi:hypothetical protein
MANHARNHNGYQARHALPVLDAFSDENDATLTEQITQMCDRFHDTYAPIVYLRPQEPMPELQPMWRRYVPGELVAG